MEKTSGRLSRVVWVIFFGWVALSATPLAMAGASEIEQLRAEQRETKDELTRARSRVRSAETRLARLQSESKPGSEFGTGDCGRCSEASSSCSPLFGRLIVPSGRGDSCVQIYTLSPDLSDSRIPASCRSEVASACGETRKKSEILALKTELKELREEVRRLEEEQTRIDRELRLARRQCEDCRSDGRAGGVRTESRYYSVHAQLGLGAGMSAAPGAYPMGLGAGVGLGSGIGLGSGVGLGSGIGLGAGIGMGSGIGMGAGIGLGSGVGMGAGIGLQSMTDYWAWQDQMRGRYATTPDWRNYQIQIGLGMGFGAGYGGGFGYY